MFVFSDMHVWYFELLQPKTNLGKLVQRPRYC